MLLISGPWAAPLMVISVPVFAFFFCWIVFFQIDLDVPMVLRKAVLPREVQFSGSAAVILAVDQELALVSPLQGFDCEIIVVENFVELFQDFFEIREFSG